MKYALSALALAAALLAPSAALAYCNGTGNSCSYASSYSKPYSQYQSPYAYQQQYRAPYGGSYGQGYGYGGYQQTLSASLSLDDGSAVVVNRGFVGFDATGAIVPPPAPDGDVTVVYSAGHGRYLFGQSWNW